MRERLLALTSTEGFRKVKVLGRGGSSVVYQAELLRQDGTNIDGFVAVKEISLDGQTEQQIEALKGEFNGTSDLRHDNIIEYYCMHQFGESLFIFLEFADRGSLRQFYQKRGALTEGQACNCITQILKGLSYLHSMGITHRDVKGGVNTIEYIYTCVFTIVREY